jgi:hypothetical protein
MIPVMMDTCKKNETVGAAHEVIETRVVFVLLWFVLT